MNGLHWVRDRIEAHCHAMGYAYPWWLPAWSAAGFVVLDALAYLQRSPLSPTPAVAVGAVLGLFPAVAGLVSPRLLLPWVEFAAVTGAVVLYLTDPVQADVAPILLMLSAGEVAAMVSLRWAMVGAADNIALIIVAVLLDRLDNPGIYFVAVPLALVVGAGLYWLMRALAAERETNSVREARAVSAERERLAREVHDVVGHSLSINLLHVTAARHALQQHADIADAVESLEEAERVGRAAMGDLRRTVSALGSAPSPTQPLPGLDDVPALIEQSRKAGLHVRFDRDPAVRGIGDAAGLGVYRILQESLANIAKHAPQAQADVSLRAGTDEVRLAVRNTLPTPHPANGAGGGSGLAGMTSRAEQLGGLLRAGVDGEHWLVELTIPGAGP